MLHFTVNYYYITCQILTVGTVFSIFFIFFFLDKEYSPSLSDAVNLDRKQYYFNHNLYRTNECFSWIENYTNKPCCAIVNLGKQFIETSGKYIISLPTNKKTCVKTN